MKKVSRKNKTKGKVNGNKKENFKKLCHFLFGKTSVTYSKWIHLVNFINLDEVINNSKLENFDK